MKKRKFAHIEMTTEQKIPIRVDDRMFPKIKPKWTVESGKATLEVSKNGRFVYIVSPDEPGTSLVAVRAPKFPISFFKVTAKQCAVGRLKWASPAVPILDKSA